MLQKIFNSWEGAIEIDGTLYNNASEIDSDIQLTDGSTIILRSNRNNKRLEEATGEHKEYHFVVKKYMTKKSTASFDFMKKWNKDIPMPMVSMVGTIEKETKGMYYLKLRAAIIGDKMITCMKCGRPLNNPVSQFFGIGPECGGHNYVNPFNTEEELKEAVNAYKKELQKVTWEGWVIKSAITTMEEYYG